MQKKRTTGLILSLIFLTIIAGFAFYVNRNIKLEALYMDDLYMWSFYGEQNIWEYTFPFRTSARFRPVYWFLSYLQMMIVGAHVKGFLTFNIITNIILAFTIYGMGTRVSGSRIAAFLASVCYLASRLSYYQIGQALGFMETLASFFALWILYFMYRFVMDSPENDAFLESHGIMPLKMSKNSCFWWGLIAYVLASFTHERYVPLGGMFYLALLICLLRAKSGTRKAWFKDNLKLWILPAATVAAIMFIRFIFIGKSIASGTGGTEVTETFSLSQTIHFCISQVMYLLGINDGPEYLNAICWENTPTNIKTLIKCSILCYGVIGLGFIASMIADLRRKFAPVCLSDTENGASTDGIADTGNCGSLGSISYGKRLLCRKLAVSLLFAGFIGACILSSSITIRLEMRWIYVSFAAMQIFACYMIRGIGTICAKPVRHFDHDATDHASIHEADNIKNADKGRALANAGIDIAILVALIVYAVYVLLSIKTNVFCRSYIDNIYFMEGQNKANNIAGETIYKFGADEVLGKTVFLVDTGYDISDFYCEYFFKPFDPEKTGQGSRLVPVNNLDEAFAYLMEHPGTVPAKPPKTNPHGNISENALYLTEDPATGKYIPLNVVN